MDYTTLVQALAAPSDKVLSIWLGAFKILALVEHPNWTDEENNGNDGEVSPDSRQFIILVMDGRAPILSPENLQIVHLIPVVGNAFNCDIDTEEGSDDSEFCVKFFTHSVEPLICVKIARGHRSQNFIDEVFRAAQIASDTEILELPWVAYYDNLKLPSQPFGGSEHEIDRITIDSSSAHGDLSSDLELEGDTDYEVVGIERDSVAKGMSGLKERDKLIKSVLESKQEQYIDLVGYRVCICTWNVNGQSPGSICLSEWLARMAEPPDIYAIGFQELDLSKEAFLFNETPKEEEWLRAVKKGLHKGAHYTKIKLERLVGMMLIVFAKDNLARQIKNIHGVCVGTGILGKMGNKGGVAVRFELEETSMCFVNSHLAAHVEEYQRRNQDFQQISTRLAFYLPQGIKYIKDHNLVFWFGDMNYRINPQSMDADLAKRYIEAEKYSRVLDYDQLKDQMRLGNVFQHYTEGPINFRPTYKYDPGTDNWDSSEKNRSPAWCDRVLWKGDNIQQIDYVSFAAYKLSDHKPVSSQFNGNVKVINPVKYRRVYEEALKRMDKLENEFLPQVTVDIPGANMAPHSQRNEIHFGNIRFLEPVKKTFTVANTGQVPVRMEFIKKLDDKHICKEWLRIEPTYAFIQPGETCEIELTALVDKMSSAHLNIGKDTMYDILVLHLENGKDIFVTVLGDFERSVFGCSINALVNMTEPICNISPGKLIELEKGQLPMGVYDIPKELWFLVDRIYRTGMEKESLFSQSGLQDEILQIRDWLNTVPNTPIPGSVDSIAETLLLLLESFPEPVIPFHLHRKCEEAASSYTSCKLILRQLPQAHRNVFVYICSFLRELLAQSDKNGMEPKLLALLFSRVMMHEVHWGSKQNSKSEKEKATFVYQFLVNEDYGEDL